MTTHKNCTHPPTKNGRAVCRKLNEILDHARAFGLHIEEHEQMPGYKEIRQFTIKNEREGVWATKILITAGYSLNAVKIPLLRESENVPIRKLNSWLYAISDVDRTIR